jgi:hypothetical protein
MIEAQAKRSAEILEQQMPRFWRSGQSGRALSFAALRPRWRLLLGPDIELSRRVAAVRAQRIQLVSVSANQGSALQSRQSATCTSGTQVHYSEGPHGSKHDSGSDGEKTGSRVRKLRYVARQPILDLQGRVFGYELLFRSGPEAVFRGNGDMASRTMLDNSVIFGLEKLTTGLPAFVNCTTQTLTEDHVLVMSPELTILEILEDVEPTPSVIEACVKLKKAGFRLALDDFMWKAELEPLVKLADYIKVDFTILDAAGRAVSPEATERSRGGAGCRESGDAGGIPAGSRGGFQAVSGVLFLPSNSAHEQKASCQPCVLYGDSAPIAE